MLLLLLIFIWIIVGGCLILPSFLSIMGPFMQLCPPRPWSPTCWRILGRLMLIWRIRIRKDRGTETGTEIGRAIGRGRGRNNLICICIQLRRQGQPHRKLPQSGCRRLLRIRELRSLLITEGMCSGRVCSLLSTKDYQSCIQAIIIPTRIGT